MIFGLPWTWVAGAVVLTFLAGFTGGCEHEKKAFDMYKARVEATAQAQAEETKKTIQKQEKIAQDTKNDYEKRISDIRRYYGRVHNDGSGTVPSPSETTGGANATPTYDVLIEQCAETTQQLTSLQDFIKETQ